MTTSVAKVAAAQRAAASGHKYLSALCHLSYVVLGPRKRDGHWEHEAFTVIGRIQGALGGHDSRTQANMGDGRWLDWDDAADELLLNVAQLDHRCYGVCEETTKVLLR